jgi:hypothetical protein
MLQQAFQMAQQAASIGKLPVPSAAWSTDAVHGCVVQEGGLMAEPVDTAIRVLAHRGPTWRAPLVIDVLRSLPIMRQVRAAVRLLMELATRNFTLSLRVVPARDMGPHFVRTA